MSNVATFTLRDLNRQPARVLAAVRKYGFVEVCSRSGEVFTLAPKRAESADMKEETNAGAEFARLSEERAKKFREMGLLPTKLGEWDEERFNRIIAGEE
jgi:antitoxin (DNA-binding transcriptional repressor) of toxin-antitoxin stability system